MQVRAGSLDDRPFLEAMLREAVFPNGPAVTVAEVMARGDLAMTIPDFSRRGDLARIAEDDGEPIGAAWCRRYTEAEHSWGFLDGATPEVGIAVVPSHRGRGVGGTLLSELIEAARAEGWDSLSLCTDRRPETTSLYARAGFVEVGPLADSTDAILMHLKL